MSDLITIDANPRQPLVVEDRGWDERTCRLRTLPLDRATMWMMGVLGADEPEMVLEQWLDAYSLRGFRFLLAPLVVLGEPYPTDLCMTPGAA